MLEKIYKVDGKYPDPYEIERELTSLQADPEELKRSLSELKDSGLGSHPLLGRFFVES